MFFVYFCYLTSPNAKASSSGNTANLVLFETSISAMRPPSITSHRKLSRFVREVIGTRKGSQHAFLGISPAQQRSA